MSVNAVHGIWPPPEKAVVSYAAAFVAISIGVVVWQFRPDSLTGVLLTAWPFAGLLAEMKIVFAGSPLAVTIGYATNWLAAPIFGHLVLSYRPDGSDTASSKALVWLVASRGPRRSRPRSPGR
jgi:hypothetical protein